MARSRRWTGPRHAHGDPRKDRRRAPGFTLRDTAGETWFIAFDPKSNPEATTGAAVIATRIFWTLGYFQAEYHISELRARRFNVDPNASSRLRRGRSGR